MYLELFDTQEYQSAFLKRILSSYKKPVGVQEYSAQSNTSWGKSWRCMFAGTDQTNDRYDEIDTTGLWSAGNYTGVRSLSKNLTTAITDISGMVNLTPNERAFAAGNMNVSEYVEYGGVK